MGKVLNNAAFYVFSSQLPAIFVIDESIIVFDRPPAETPLPVLVDIVEIQLLRFILRFGLSCIQSTFFPLLTSPFSFTTASIAESTKHMMSKENWS